MTTSWFTLTNKSKFVTDNLAKVQENNESSISSASKSYEVLMKKLEEKKQ